METSRKEYKETFDKYNIQTVLLSTLDYSKQSVKFTERLKGDGWVGTYCDGTAVVLVYNRN